MAIVLHPLADLSNAWPPFFVDNLLEVYKHGKSGLKFQMLRNLLVRSLPSAPLPGPATFIVHCLEILQHIGLPHNEGLSHMMIAALCESDRSSWSSRDEAIARKLAGSLFCKALSGRLHMEPRIVVKLPVAFNFDLRDLGEILNPGKSEEVVQWQAARDFVECYTVQLLKRRLYSGAVSLMKSFDFQTCNYQALIATMVDQGQADMAIDCAAYLGKDTLKFLVQHCTDSGFSKVAYKVVNQYKLKEEFPDTYYLYKKSCLRKLVAKGSWKVAQSIAEGDAVLIDYLVMLAIEDKDAEMVEELSELFNLDIIPISPDTQINSETSPFLQLESLMSIDNVHWIDTHEKLQFAERALFGVKLVGIDCEWKPDTTKSVAPSKVSILQVASSELVLVLDLISLLKECSSSLVSFIKYLFHSPDIVKLGYAIHNDLARLSRSYKELDAFALCESVLDLRSVFGGRIKGGLSGLAKEILGSSLNKRTQMSNWETRPLSKKQLHYAALDAAVLLPIFNLLPEHSTLTSEVQGAGPHLTRFGGKANTGASDRTKEQSHVSTSHEDLQPAYKNNTHFRAKRSNAGGLEQACMNLTRITSHEDLRPIV